MNLKYENGNTPLINALKNRDFGKVCQLLKHGAQVPDLAKEVEFSVKINGKEEKQNVTLQEHLKKYPHILNVLSEGPREAESKLPQVETSLLTRPAITIIRNYMFEVKSESIFLRVFSVAAPIFASSVVIGLNLGMAAAAPLAIAFFAVPYWLYKSEWSKATKVLNNIAMQEFARKLPDCKVMEYISKNEHLVSQLTTPEEVLKYDDNGNTLLSLICEKKYYSFEKSDPIKELKIFEKLTELLFKKEWSSKMKLEYLLMAIKSEKPAFVKSLFASHKVKLDDFTPVQQHKCWVAANDKETLKTLKSYGFDINARDKKGHTPLITILDQNIKNLSPNFNMFDTLNAMIKAGADINATGEFLDNKGDYVTKSVVDLAQKTKNDAIIRLFTLSKPTP